MAVHAHLKQETIEPDIVTFRQPAKGRERSVGPKASGSVALVKLSSLLLLSATENPYRWQTWRLIDVNALAAYSTPTPYAVRARKSMISCENSGPLSS